MNPIEEDKKSRRALIICGAALFTVLTACAVWFYLAQEKNMKQEQADYVLKLGQKEYYLPCDAGDLPFDYIQPDGTDAGKQDSVDRWRTLTAYGKNEAGEDVPIVSVQCLNAEEVLRAGKDCTAVGLRVEEACPVAFSIAGVSEGDTPERVEAVLGQPDEVTAEGAWRYAVEGETGSSLTFYFSDGQTAAFDLTRGEGYPFAAAELEG